MSYWQTSMNAINQGWQNFKNDFNEGWQDMVNVVKHGTNAQGESIFKPSSTIDAGFQQGLNNFFTGNLDYQRTLEAMREGNKFSAEQAQIQREWEERMSNTAMSRQIADLKKVGINPYVALGGSGASTPSFSAPSSATAQPQKSGQGFGVIGSLLSSLLVAGITSAVKSDIANKQLQNQINRLDKTLDSRFALAEFKSNSASDLVRLRASYKPNITEYYTHTPRGAIKTYTKYKGRI